MDALTISAASGLRARMETLDMLANNLANASTGGFKLDREFYSLYVSPEADGSSGTLTTVPLIEKHWTDFSQGLLTPTGNSLDLALSGKGFFAVSAPSGVLYTRNGSFRLSPKGVLETPDGYPVQAQNLKFIQSKSSSALQFMRDGEVRQDGQTLGKLQLVDFPAEADLSKEGNNYFRPADPKIKLAPAAAAQVEQGRSKIPTSLPPNPPFAWSASCGNSKC